MRHALFATFIALSSGGCGDTSPATIDAAPPDQPREPPCSSDVTSTVSVAGDTYGFAALGNVDAGGESACGGAPEAVMVMFSIDPAADVAARIQYMNLTLPVSTGTMPATMYPGTRGPGITVSLDVTAVQAAPSGPGLAQIAGTLSGAATGTFAASVCPRLTTSCI